MLRYVRSHRRRALQLQQQRKDSIDLLEAFKTGRRVVSSLDELVRVEGRKTWMVIRYMLEKVTGSTSVDEELMWCPRSQDFVHVNSCVTCFPEREGFPMDLYGDFSYRGIVVTTGVDKEVFIKNPLAKQYATVALPADYDKIPLYANYTGSDDGFYLSRDRATPAKDMSFHLYSSMEKKWGVCRSSVEDKEDKEHSLKDFLGAWMRGLRLDEREDLMLYNPVYDSWKCIPMLPEVDYCVYKLHDYQGRLYGFLDMSGSRFKVLVYCEELRSWSSLCDWTEHRQPKTSLTAVPITGEGPYFFAYMEGPEPPFLKIFDLDKLCWYHAEIPFHSRVLGYTPTDYQVL